MSSSAIRMENMLFDNKTTYLNDYQPEHIQRPTQTKYQVKPTCLMRRLPPLKDVNTMTDWKTQVPFNLLHKPRPMVDTNPRKMQQPYSKPIDEEREQIQKTRPRLDMTPAVRIDDITDSAARSYLVNDLYTSQKELGLRAGIPELFHVKSPFVENAPSRPIFLEKYKPGVVPPEWRMDSVVWDLRQLRGHCDVTRDFWLQKELKHCQPCQDTSNVENYRKMKRQIRARKH